MEVDEKKMSKLVFAKIIVKFKITGIGKTHPIMK